MLGTAMAGGGYMPEGIGIGGGGMVVGNGNVPNGVWKPKFGNICTKS